MHLDERDEYWLDMPRACICCSHNKLYILVSNHVGEFQQSIPRLFISATAVSITRHMFDDIEMKVWNTNSNNKMVNVN